MIIKIKQWWLRFTTAPADLVRSDCAKWCNNNNLLGATSKKVISVIIGNMNKGDTLLAYEYFVKRKDKHSMFITEILQAKLIIMNEDE